MGMYSMHAALLKRRHSFSSTTSKKHETLGCCYTQPVSRRKCEALDARSSGDPFDPAESDAEVDPHADPASVSNIATTDVHGDQAARSIHKARLDIAEWTWNLGPESGWEYWVAEETRMAERHNSMEEFFGTFREHARKGRELLHGMQHLFHLSLRGSSLEEVKDIFLQGHTLTCISKDLGMVVMVRWFVVACTPSICPIPTMKRASGSSRRVQVISTSRVDPKSSVLAHKALQGQKKINVNCGRERLQQMSEEELELRNQQVTDAQNAIVVDQDIEMQYNEVLLGRLPLDISNAGGEMAAVAEVY
ncbi:hypothetical protein FIBSPDRAFT_904342 [Athelia psychrophila]|uniref:Uncharacterized protein n=1 Tax=Athelia psychrophila TaxID=1759441 RepID=A0A167UW48_9AGAM|nr:hypothetical protein FIBSPDRAFT_904342 [Fibularhizoctonia sp. CBS 109695]